MLEIADPKLTTTWIVGWCLAAPFIGWWLYRRERYGKLAVACLLVAVGVALHHATGRFYAMQFDGGGVQLWYLWRSEPRRVDRADVVFIAWEKAPYRGDMSPFVRLILTDGTEVDSLSGPHRSVHSAMTAAGRWLPGQTKDPSANDFPF